MGVAASIYFPGGIADIPQITLYWSRRCIFQDSSFSVSNSKVLVSFNISHHCWGHFCSVSADIILLDGLFRGYICWIPGSLVKRLMYDVMISSPDMLWWQKEIHVWWDCDFQVERLLCSWWTCEWAKPSARSLFHRSGWSFFNLNKAMLYAVPHLLEGYKKAMKVMMRMPKLQQSESDPDAKCEHIWAAERGYIILPLMSSRCC